MKKQNKINTESVQEAPVLEAIAIPEIITQELIKNNITDSTLSAMEAKAAELSIAGIEDKKGYEAVHELRITCRDTRNMAVKLCKLGRSEAIKIQKAWISREEEIVERIEKIEAGLYEKQKVVDEEKERIKNEKALKEQAILQERSVKLIQFGMNFTGDAYVLEDITISVLAVKSLDSFTWTAQLAKVEAIYNSLEAARQEKIRLEEERAAELKRIAEENATKEAEIRQREEAMAAREKAILEAEAKVKAEAEAKIKLEEEAKIAAEKKAVDDKIKFRRSALFQLGFSQQGNKLSFKELVVYDEGLLKLDDETWPYYIAAMTSSVTEVKEKLELERAQREEQIKNDAIEAERKRLKDIADKAEADRIAQEAEATRIAALAPDITKFNSYLKTIADTPLPEFTTENYKAYSEQIKIQITATLTRIHIERPK